ncbi:MAG: iron-containing alcohol dehydrogenase, partial [Anaerolineae bacterium]|nr:iron-containing alcohol dehydrogenase [Anaerolineae bacterium]
MRFEFATAGRIIFGEGEIGNIGELAAGFGSSALVVTGSDRFRVRSLWKSLGESGIATIAYTVPQEPTTVLVAAGTALARENNCDLVIGCGGGSVLDAAKAISILLTNGGNPLDYLEVVGKGLPFTKPAAPCIVVPTTAGTGTEVTKNAVLVSPENRVKVSLRSPWLLPQVALVDPLLTHTMPRHVTASTGLDAFTQVVEPYVTHLSNPITDAVCREGLQRVSLSLRRVYENGQDAEARKDMAIASLCGGLALANAKLGAIHGFASVIGGQFDAPHGVICGRLLPDVMRANIRALQQRDAESPALARFQVIAQILTESTKARAEDGVRWVEDLV